MTRALLSLLQFDFAKAFHYHPLFGIVILVAIYFILKYLFHIQMSEKKEKAILWIIGILFIVVYAGRLFHGSEVVTFHPEKSIIYKIISIIK